MKHVFAPLNGFETIPSIEAALSPAPPEKRPIPLRRYPIRYLRYWFIRHALTKLQERLGRPVRVLEVGIGGGKMLAFMGGPSKSPGRYARPTGIETWDALSAQADPEVIERYSYSSFRQADLDRPLDLAGDRYDAIILLHVLEHLENPEGTIDRLLPFLNENGILVGGSPTMPDLVGRLHESQLRRRNASKMGDPTDNKHISVITPARMRRLARAHGLAADMLTGAFLMRFSRSILEDYALWLRANMIWGALVPSLGGEVYFSLRRR